jgi:hypothetical protein
MFIIRLHVIHHIALRYYLRFQVNYGKSWIVLLVDTEALRYLLQARPYYL